MKSSTKSWENDKAVMQLIYTHFNIVITDGWFNLRAFEFIRCCVISYKAMFYQWKPRFIVSRALDLDHKD